jgi:hypothetical protein
MQLSERGDNMKNVYEKPEVTIVNFNNEDIITASGGLVVSKFTMDSENVVEF